MSKTNQKEFLLILLK